MSHNQDIADEIRLAIVRLQDAQNESRQVNTKLTSKLEQLHAVWQGNAAVQFRAANEWRTELEQLDTLLNEVNAELVNMAQDAENIR